MQFFVGLVIGICIGHTLGNRRDGRNHLGRKIQLIALMCELKGYRLKGRRPVLNNWVKFWLSWLYEMSPTFTRYLSLSPVTLIRWHRSFCKRWWTWKSRPRRDNAKRGRPKLPEDLERLVLAIRADNPRYGHRKIAAILTTQLGIKISETKVRNILNAYHGDTTPSHSNQTWKTFLRNHRAEIASMDFKSTFDWRGRQVFILNIIDHARRKLLWSRASYHPNSQWASLQMREVFGGDVTPKFMVIDNDSIFLPVAKLTLPGMGIEVVRTGFKSPWQNGVVERFNRTLDDDLLDHIIPMSEKQLNRLLTQYRDYYNHGRPHQANDGKSPVTLEAASNDASFMPNSAVEKIPWLNGLHHSYCLAA
jgi:putative transposase